MENKSLHKLGIDIGSTTVKVAVLDEQDNLLFSDYERHFANIQETLTSLIQKAFDQLGELSVAPMITGSGGLTLAKHLEVPFVQEVISVTMPRRQMWRLNSVVKMQKLYILKAVMLSSV